MKKSLLKEPLNTFSSFALGSVFVIAFILSSIGNGFAQIATQSFNFNNAATGTQGWTGSFFRFTGATACSGNAALRYNLYSFASTATLVSPSLGTSNGGVVTLSYLYKANNWSANTAGTNPWGNFTVQYGSSAAGPWTTVATVNNETQSGSCISKTHSFVVPVGTTFIRYNCTWTSGDYYLNFDEINISQAAVSACSGTPNTGTTSISANNGCAGASVTLNSAGLSSGNGILYQWQQSINGGATWTNIAGATSTSATVTPTATTLYRIVTTCANSFIASNSSTVTYSVNTCSGSITMTDSWGDGWNGAVMTLNVNGSPFQTFSLGGGASQTVNFCLPQASTYSLFYTNGGSYPTEVGVSLTINGTQVYAVGFGGATVNTTLVSGNACPPVCAGVPNNGTASVSASTACVGSSIVLSGTGLTAATGVNYQWQSGPSATGPWTNIAGATGQNTTISALAGTIFYRIVSTCTFSASAANSNAIAVNGVACSSLNVPQSGFNFNPCGNNTFLYDNGGSGGNYADNSNGYTVIENTGTSILTLSGTFSGIETCCDYLRIYNGIGTGGTLLNSYIGTGNIVSFTSAPGQTITVQFYSDGSVTGAGFNLTANYVGGLCLQCSGTPTPGATVATPNSVFAGQTTNLSFQNIPSGAGITYQWQSAPTATGPWTNIVGGTTLNYTVTPTATTWYQCIVTCTNTASTTISTPVQVLYNPYCNPAYVYGTFDGDLISNVAITGTTLNNNSGTSTSGPAYTYYSNLPAAVMSAASSYQVQVTCGSFSYQAFAVWIDYNDNYTFEASEKVGFSTAYTTTSFETVSFNINLACTPPLGLHRMRVRGVYYTPGASIDPCATYFYGETEDYNVNIIAAVPFTPSYTVAPGNQACTFTDYTYTTQTGMQSYTWGFPGTAGVNYNIISGGTTTSNTATVQYLTAGSQNVSLNYLNASGCTSTGPVSNTITVQATAQIAPLAGTQTVCAGSTVSFSTTSTGGTWSSSNPAIATINPNTGVVTGVAAGTATMTYTILNSTTWCPPSTATRTVTVNASPIVNAGPDVTICSNQSTNLVGSVTPATVNGSCSQNYSGSGNDCSNFFIGGISNCAPAGAIITSITYQAVIGPYCTTWYNWILFVNGAQITTGCNGTFTYNGLNGQPANGQLLQLRSIDNDFYCDFVNMQFNVTINYTIPVNFSWAAAPSLTNTTSLTPSASPMQTTTYTLSSTNSLGCTSSDQVVVNVNQSPANAPIIAPSVLCVGNNGMVSNPVPNGTWSVNSPSVMSLNAATGDIVGVGAGTATVSYTTTATNGCTTTTTANIGVQALPVASISSSNGNSVCQGTATTLTAPAAASYAWNNGATTQTISVTAGGTYSVIITSAAGCVSNPSAPLTLTVNQPPVANAIVSGPTTFCQGGSVVLTASGGTSYTWNNSINAAANTINTSGTYTATVTNAAGCSANTAPITVNVLPAPAASITANGPTAFCAGGSVVLAANGAGSYVWSNGSTAASIAVNNSGSFAYTVTDANGCTTTTAPTAVSVTPLPVVASIAGANTVCQGTNTLFTNATSGGAWSSSNAAIASIDATGSISGVTGGNATISYTVTNNGCSTTEVKNIAVQTAPVTSISVSGPTTFCAGGSVVLSAAAGSGFNWTNTSTAQSITVTSSGTYGVSVTNGQGCASIAAPVSITVVPFPVLDAIAGSNTVCIGATEAMSNTTTGGVWASSNAGVASVSSNGVVSGNNAGAATISYTFTNAAGCTSTVTKPIAVNVIPSAVVSANGPTTFCAGGSVTLTAPAASSYLWSTGETTQSVTPNSTVMIDVIVTTAGCSATSAPVAVTVNALPTPVVTTNNVAICQGTAATLTSTPAAAYLWNNGSTNASINVTSAGNYTVTVTDANGCSASSAPLAIAVSANPSVSIAAAGPTTFCQGQSVVLNTNTNGASYLWSNGALTPSITVNNSGLYFVTVTNAAGCSSVSNEISVNTQASFVPTITAASTTTVCAGAFSTLVASSGASYVWSNGATTQGVNVGVNGPITVTVTNALGCVGTSAPLNVTVLPVPTTTITASGATTFCEGGSVTLTAGGANSYIWANNSTATNQTVTTAGTYVVTGYAANGCPDLAEITVTVNESPSAELITDGNNSLCPGEVLTLSAQPGNVYNWTPGGSTAQELAVTTPGTYSCTLTSLNGCTTASEQIVVTAAQPTSTTLNITALQNYVLNEITYSQSGTYTQVLTNAAGCDSTITLNLTLTVGLDENSFVTCSVQPNPTDAIFTLVASEALYSNYVIQDAQGKVVATGNLTGTSTTINIDQVARGIYFLKVTEAAEAIRIVKN
jgi:hypothetical protein